MDKKSDVPDSVENRLHFLDYWRIIRLRKTVILIVLLLVVATTTIFTLLWKKTYSSMVRIQVEKDVTDISGLDNRASYSPYDLFWIQTQFEVIQSSSVLNKVIEKLNLIDRWTTRYEFPEKLTLTQTYQILKSQINLRQSRNTSLIEIWVYSELKEEAPEIANTIAEVYRERRLSLRKTNRAAGLGTLQDELKDQEGKAKVEKDALNEYRRTNNIPDLMEGTVGNTMLLSTDTLRGLEQLRLRAEDDYTAENTQYHSITNLSHEELRNALTTAYPYDTQLTSLAEKYDSGQLQLAGLLKQYKDEAPEVQTARGLVDKASELLDGKITGILLGLKTRTERSKARLDELEKQVNDERKRNAERASVIVSYLDSKRDLENLQRLIEATRFKIQTERIETDLPTLTIVDVTDLAVVNPRPVKPNKALNIGLSIVFGLALGIGLAFFIEYLDTSVKTIDDVERALQSPVIGVIPQNVGILLEEGPDTPHAEAYRVLRTNILFSRTDETWNTLTALSSGAGEGKSTTLFNLATIFAQNGSRCLVVDSDLRRPSIHKILKVSNTIGLTNFLLKQNLLEEVIQTTSVPGLDFMPSGKLPSSSMGILSSDKMKEMIKEVKGRYDFVFFDSPPLLGVSDASILASEVDMVLQVVQYRRYPQPMTIRAKQMITKVGGNLLGIVLNNISMSQDQNYYYYGGYYEDSDQPSTKSKPAKV
ncbi:MAG: polysaccharide biosynthesis tyrosine autokinase [Verrucomicrobiota bacterium]